MININENIKKVFTSKDVFYNNGIVNLVQFLKENELNIKYTFEDSVLIIEYDEFSFRQIFSLFIKDNKIIRQTKNDRWYFDEKLKIFRIDKRYEIIGASSGNDIKNSYLYKTPEELNLSIELIQDKYLNFCIEQMILPDIKDEVIVDGKKIKPIDYIKKQLSIDKKSNEDDKLKIIKYIDEHREFLKVPNGDNKVVLYSLIEDIIDNSIDNYFVKANNLALNSSIHSFEDGQSSFHDMLPNDKIVIIDGEKIKAIKTIDKWDALIYWFGNRIKRFYNYSYFIYPNSSNLEALASFKEFLKITDDKIDHRDEKDKIISTSSNINFYAVLKNDGIVNKHFYISKSAEEFEIKFFMYLFSVIYHIEERYEKANERRRERQKELFDTLQYLSFVIYTEDGTFKASLNEYTRAYQLIQFFQILKENDLFKYLSELLIIFSFSQGSKEVNLNLVAFCQHLLDFKSLRKEYYYTSFNILKNNSKGFGKILFEFEQLYLNNILGGKKMSIHENAKKVGDGIGHFCAELGDKDLLFKLRNVKNYKQMLSYFKDLKFSTLKNQSDARFSKDFNESLEVILGDIEENWEVYRDYIAIYAIDKFKAVSYAKTK
jgi:hypothetical protein